MNMRHIEAHELIVKAREALRRGDKPLAMQLGERAARLAPTMEDVWLVLAAAAPSPRQALAHAQKALQIQPQSLRARRAVEWASNRLPQSPVNPALPPSQVEGTAPQKTHAYQTAVAMPALKRQGTNWLVPALLLGIGVLFLVSLVFFALIARNGGFASIVSGIRLPFATEETLWAPAEVAKPEVTPIDVNAFAAQAETTPTPNSLPTLRATATASPEPEATETPVAVTATPAATETPASLMMEIVEDTPTSVPPTPGISVGDGVRWIDVDLTNQMVYAYEGDTVVNSFVVSTGTWLTPTVTGKHKIYVKVRVQDMSGPGYHLRDVPYVMFFSGDYGLHGTYWHNNFGTPMSRGCVNLTIDDAAWLFNWASVGTVVNVHY